MKKDINLLFQDAQNSETALKELTDVLMSYGKSVAKSIINRYNIYSITIDDVEDYILGLVNELITNYKKDKLSFRDYVIFVMYKRLTSKIMDTCTKRIPNVISLDECFDDDTPLYDIIENRQCESIPGCISYDEFHLNMCSPNAGDNSMSILKKKIYSLKDQGFTGQEITKFLKISVGQYRYLEKKIKQDLKTMEKKMELK